MQVGQPARRVLAVIRRCCRLVQTVDATDSVPMQIWYISAQELTCLHPSSRERGQGPTPCLCGSCHHWHRKGQGTRMRPILQKHIS